MKRTIIGFLTLSICFAGDNLPAQLDHIINALQKKYDVYSLEDLHKLKNPSQPSPRTASRDMEDIVGDWVLEEESVELFVTVGTDQSIPDPFSLLGLVEAEGGITATADDFETELNYLIFMDLFGGDDDSDCDINCEGEYYDYMDEGIDVSDEYCECCHEDYPIDEICEDDSSRDDHYGGTLDFESIADMNFGRYGAAYTTDGNMVYALCGANWDSVEESTIYHTHGERYNPEEDSWEMFGENLLKRRYTTAEYVDGNIYLFNGYNGESASDTVEIINTETGEVSYSATNPYPVWYGGSAVWDDKIYVFGGGNGSEYSNRLYVFDPSDETWTRLADMPDSINTNGVIVDDVLYTFGGYNGEVSSDINAYYIYDDVWETVGEMSTTISANSVATDGEIIFVIGDYSDIEFTGVYDPSEDIFLELETNMEGRRHSASVVLNGDIYAYGGSQPEGFNGNESYVILSSAERGYHDIDWEDDDGDDWEPEALITNMNLMEFFMVMFGVDPDSLGLENPILVGATSTQTEDGDIVMNGVGAMIVLDGIMDAYADSAEAVANTSIDTLTGAATFNNLVLYDSTGAAVLTLSGTIGPSMLDFVAGEETSFPFLEDLEDMFEEDDEDLFVSFYEDSTGMEIEVGYDDYYYYGTWADTSYFTWEATTDSLFIYSEDEDYYDEIDTTELEYVIDGDILTMGASFDPCDEEDSFEECLEFASEEIAGLDELEDVESLRLSMERVLAPGSFTAVDPGDGSLPEAFNLYANFPNPFNPVTTIRFDVGQNTGHNTILRIYDITGRVVATLVNGQLQTGTYEAQWDARGFASGIYFSELVSGTNRQTQKMVLLK